MIHSVPALRQAEPYEMIVRRSPLHLRPYALGAAGFRTRTAEDARMLPLNAATLIVDFTGMSPIVTGPRATATFAVRTPWRHGMAVGLTPVGMSALTGAPVREVAGATVPLADLLGVRAEELAGRLGESASWDERFALLWERLTAWLCPGPGRDHLIMRAWWRLQAPDCPRTIAGLAAEVGVSRRYVELGFRRVVGLSPKTVARIARFQRTVDSWRRPSATLDAALSCGFADQPHLSREIRAMSRLTPAQLFAFVQDTGRLAE